MKQLAEKIQQFEKEVSMQKGDFLFCALILRDRSHARWDLVLSAPWFETKRSNTLKYLISRLEKNLSKKELSQISKIVLLDPSDQFLVDIARAIRNIASAVHVEHGLIEISNCVFDGIEIDHMYLITSKSLTSVK